MKTEKMKYKKGAIGKTITWIIATLLVIVMLFFSIFIVSFIKNNKQFSIEKWNDLVAMKSLSSYLLSKDISGSTIFKQIREDEQISFTNNLFFDLIFKRIYHEDFPGQISLGISSTFLDYQNLLYSLRGVGGSLVATVYISEKVIFKDKTETKDKEDKYLELTLMGR